MISSWQQEQRNSTGAENDRDHAMETAWAEVIPI
jgi:hypothetical protein